MTGGGHRGERRSLLPISGCLAGIVVAAALIVGARDRGPGQDEGVWMLVARAWVDDGAPPYQGPIDNKPPGIFYVFALSHALFGDAVWPPRLLGVLAAGGTCVLLGALGRRLGGRASGLVAALAGGLVLAAPGLGGRVAAESFLVPLTTLSVYLVAAGADQPPARRRRHLTAAGTALGLALAFKQVALFMAPVLVAWSWAATPVDRRTPGRGAGDAAVLAAGAGAGAVIGLLPLLLAGVTLAEYWQGAWLTLLDPGSALYPLGARVPNLARLLDHPLVVLVAAAALAPIAAPRRWRAPLAVWLVAGLLAPAVSGHFAGHQLRTIVPPGALALGLLIGGAASRVPVAALAAVITVALAPHQPIVNAVMGRPPQRHYAAHEDVGTWVRAATAPDDLVFAWVIGGVMPAVAQRRSPSRHVNANLARTPAAIAEVTRDLAARPPRMIVVQGDAPEWLARVMTGRYARVFARGPLTVYERR
jgi:hypothetical protein